MEYCILLNRNEDTKSVEGQEQSRFIKSILEALEVPIEFNPDEALSIENRQKLRHHFKEFNLHIIDDINGGIKVYVGEDLIGEWYKSTYKLKQDLTQKHHQDRLFLEMLVKFWTIFEEGSEMQS